MRKLVATELVSMDGVVESPDEWAFSYTDDEMAAEDEAGMAASDALLLGRATYEEFAAFWPNQPGGTPMVDYINSVRKYVVSTTLEEPLEWNNSTVIEGDFVEGISALKNQPGKDITVTGSLTLVRSLMREGLLDELRCVVCPVVRGTGRRLFEDEADRRALELVDSKTFATGAVTLTYRPTAGE
ncbi:MAG: dihydrofolate reductase family protein [Actinomycetota bacterium]|jgi:dihydrofolate reductase|nr:dihydrofolate reductase [Rubrobacter sp.]MDQ3506417.1 dihydrofolate reductase family protein [Actinomycetota bacterium]